MQGVDHYENFPVASWLCPRPLRAPIAAIYHYARTADDLADEGDADAATRLADLAAYRADLERVLASQSPSVRWKPVFEALGRALAQHGLPNQPLRDLLDAFEQDVRQTAGGLHYASMSDLLDYCRRSAQPVGRLLLHLYGVGDAKALCQSDAICSALQLINFWQDLGLDLSRGRHYLPRDRLRTHGVDEDRLRWAPDDAKQMTAARAMMTELVQEARALMLAGAPLALRLPGRVGWELRLVVQGGLRICDKLADRGCDSWRWRPRLSASDLPAMLWRSARMRA
jgi:hydroxysqualene synthase